MSEKDKMFNLLKPIKPPPSLWDRIYTWILVRARVVILVAELLAVVSFGLKVVEDTNAANKEKLISTLSTRLEFYANKSEDPIRKLIQKSDTYSAIWNNSSIYNEVLKEITNFLIANTSFSNFTLKIVENTVSLQGYDSLANLSRLENSMKNIAETIDRNSVRVSDLTLNEADIRNGKALIIIQAEIKSDITRERL